MPARVARAPGLGRGCVWREEDRDFRTPALPAGCCRGADRTPEQRGGARAVSLAPGASQGSSTVSPARRGAAQGRRSRNGRTCAGAHVSARDAVTFPDP